MGDYARTLVIENGIVCDEIDRIKRDEWRNGLQMEAYLHKTLMDVATPEMTFEELYYYINDLIVKKEFLNLDFLGNLGHSIVKNKSDRVYTEKGNCKRLSDVEMFTFEPHISIPDSKSSAASKFDKNNLNWMNRNGKDKKFFIGTSRKQR